MDWYVLLTPLFVLAVVLLLGFAGCDALFGLDPIPQSVPLVLRARVPAGLTVLMSTPTEVRSRFRWKAGSSPGFIVGDMLTSRMDGTDTLVEFQIPDGEAAGWQVECILQVRDGTTRGDATGVGNFILQQPATPGTGYAAVFTATGRPSTPADDPFRIDFIPGLLPE